MNQQTMVMAATTLSSPERTVSIEQQLQGRRHHETKLGPVRRHSPTAAIHANVFDSVDKEFSMIEPPQQQHQPSLLAAIRENMAAKSPDDDNKRADDGLQQQLPHQPPPPAATMASSVLTTRQKQRQPEKGTTERKTRLLQERHNEIRLARGLLIAFCHASRCTAKSCTMSRYCRDFKLVWKHIVVHHQQQPQSGGASSSSRQRRRRGTCCGCHHPACLQGRAVLEHFGRCQRRSCPVCGPVVANIPRLLRDTAAAAAAAAKKEAKDGATNNTGSSSPMRPLRRRATGGPLKKRQVLDPLQKTTQTAPGSC